MFTVMPAREVRVATEGSPLPLRQPVERFVTKGSALSGYSPAYKLAGGSDIRCLLAAGCLINFSESKITDGTTGMTGILLDVTFGNTHCPMDQENYRSRQFHER